MHNIFFVPELLNEILSYSSKHTNTIAARVCRLWFTHSISFIWDTVDLNQALEVLSPVSYDSDDLDVGFQQPLSPHSWSRFLLYSKNVRKLDCYQIHYSALRQAVLWKPYGHLFSPKLTSLYWQGWTRDIDYLVPLLTSTLQILHLVMDGITTRNPIDVLCNTIPFRSPSLRALELVFPPTDIDDHLHTAISQSLAKLLSPELVLLSLPLFCMSEELFTTLSRLPRLENLLLCDICTSEFSELHVKDLPKRLVMEEEEAKRLPFPSLCKLHVANPKHTFTMMENVLGNSDFQFLKLTELDCCSIETIMDYQFISLMESVHTICPNVQKTSISAEYILPWQAIRPLLQCPALVELRSEGKVDMELEDIVTIATNRSSWKVINLPSVTPLSYQALVVFAQNCPDLVELGLTLKDGLEFPGFKIPPTDVKFSSLNLLDVGDSIVLTSIMTEVATFLSCICGKPPKIKAASSLWMAIEKMIMLQIRNQGLEDEVVLLRARIKDSG